MNQSKFVSLAAIEYAVSVFNEITLANSSEEKQFEIVWDTSLGPATARLVQYHTELTNYPIIKEELTPFGLSLEVYKPEEKNYDLFSIIRHKIFDFFAPEPFYNFEKAFLIKRPDILLEKLINLSQVELSDDIVIPNYSTVWEFKTLDGNIELPFIRNIEISQPISLILKN